MKTPPPTKKKQPAASTSRKSLHVSPAAKRIGGQPEIDEAARTAGLKSAMADETPVSSGSSPTAKRRKR